MDWQHGLGGVHEAQSAAFFVVTKRGVRTSLDGGAGHGICGNAGLLTNVLRGTRHATAAASRYASATVRGALWVACVEYPGFRFSFRAWHLRRSLCVCVVRVCWCARDRKNCSQVCLALSRKLEHIQACGAGCFAGLFFLRGFSFLAGLLCAVLLPAVGCQRLWHIVCHVMRWPLQRSPAQRYQTTQINRTLRSGSA